MSWNCQGLGSPLTVRTLRALVAQEKPAVLFLMETKNPEERVQHLMRKLKFDELFVVNPVGLRGGLAVMWKAETSLSVNSASDEIIDIEYNEERYDTKMRVTFVHAPNDFNARLAMWAEIRNSGNQSTQPWLCIGDFNEILYPWEKAGGRIPDYYRMHAFRDCLNDCNLMELESKGCAFTWSNRREGDAHIKERLDRAVSDLNWRLTFPEAEIFALPAMGSDHSPLLVTLFQPAKTKRTFSFEAFWLADEQCGQVIKTAWNDLPSSSDLSCRLRRVSSDLSTWSKKRFPNRRVRMQRIMEEMECITNNCPVGEGTQQLSNLQGELAKLWHQEELFWGIRSRITWLKWGDQNTKFFHATTIQRRQRNRISMLKDSSEQWIRHAPTIQKMTLEYFTKLYTSVGDRNFAPILNYCPCKVNEAMNSQLLAEVTMEEVKTATFQLGATKAPGPDGLNGQFFQGYWEDIKDSVYAEVKGFFLTGKLNPNLNRTSITLVPKIKNPEKLEQFRPISVCNFAYRIISKVLANRLKPLLPDLIEPEQSAFVGGRMIQDNILVVQEVLHQLRVRERKKKFQAVLKVDMQKAYDRVE